MLENYYESSTGTDEIKKEAIEWYLKYASNGNAETQNKEVILKEGVWMVTVSAEQGILVLKLVEEYILDFKLASKILEHRVYCLRKNLMQ
ncbi:14644_t:CDS:2 [Funneliformis caledonium]|uniref:14644_t:CDS:1 n=1 Tax=Funneliformis caledonium TaxID=1117310 RepID=A0A9N9HPG4_9GLOM|nr:14644_t:CDS:2 [Funneliformis caledonium]